MTKPTETFDGYIAARSAPVRKSLEALRKLVHKTLPNAEESFKWGAPVFSINNQEPIIYLYGGKDHAHLGFVQGTSLDDPEDILVGRGKSGRHVKVYPGKPLRTKALSTLLKQCEPLE